MDETGRHAYDFLPKYEPEHYSSGRYEPPTPQYSHRGGSAPRYEAPRYEEPKYEAPKYGSDGRDYNTPPPQEYVEVRPYAPSRTTNYDDWYDMPAGRAYGYEKPKSSGYGYKEESWRPGRTTNYDDWYDMPAGRAYGYAAY